MTAVRSNRTLLIAVVGTGATGAMIFNILPVFLGKAAESHALSDGAVGWLGTVYLAGFGLSSITAAFWLQLVNRKILAFSAFGAAALLVLLAAVPESYVGVAATLFAVGLALGVLYTLSFVLVGEIQDSTRAVGIKLGGEVVLGALLLFLLPALVHPFFGFPGMLAALAAILLIASPCARFIPPASPAAQPTATAEHPGQLHMPLPALVALAALFVFTVGQSGVWSFVERAGVRAGHDSASIGAILSVAVLIGGFGSFLAATISERFGKTAPLVFAAMVYALAMLLFTIAQGLTLYASAVSLFFFAWLFALPYFVSAVAASDISGRATSLVTACLAFASMLAPAIAGQLVRDADFRSLHLAGAVATATAYITIILLKRSNSSVARRARLT